MDWSVAITILAIAVIVLGVIVKSKGNNTPNEFKELANFREVTITETQAPIEKWINFIKNYAHLIYKNGGFPKEALALWQLSYETERPLLVLVMGEFKTGKSTFINTLLGENILVSDVAPATAVVTLLKFGTHKKVCLHLKNGDIEEYSYEKLAEITAEGNEEKQALREKIAYVEVEYPNAMLKKINLVDTPGLNVHKDEHIKGTTDFQQKADMVLWVFNAARNASRTEMDEIRSLGERLKPIAIVNRIDLIDEEEESVEEVLNSVRKRMGDTVQTVFGVSSLKAQKALKNNDQDELANSGWTNLWKEINDQIVEKSEELKITSIRNKLNAFLLVFENSIKNKELKIKERDGYFINQNETRNKFMTHINNLQYSQEMLIKCVQTFENVYNNTYVNTICRFEYDDFFSEDKLRSFANTILHCSDDYYSTMQLLQTCENCDELLKNMQMYSSYRQRNSDEFKYCFPKRIPILQELEFINEDIALIEKERYVYEHSGIFGNVPITDFSGKRKRLNTHIDTCNQRINNNNSNIKKWLGKFKRICHSELEQDREIKKQISKINKLYKKEEKKYQKELLNIERNFDSEKEKHQQTKTQTSNAKFICNQMKRLI